MMGAYYRRMTGEDDEMRVEAAKIWSRWELATSRLFVDDTFLGKVNDELWALQHSRIEWLVLFTTSFANLI
jgi:proline iminopeptidase